MTPERALKLSARLTPQDDLTAEQAAKIVGIIDGLAYIDPNDHRKCEEAIRPIIQQTRQEALREARQLVSTMFDQQASELPDYYAALLDVGNALDRLASEGG